MKRANDHHSYSRPDEAVVTHLNWNAAVDFDTRVITATATYDIEAAADAERIIFDCTDLTSSGARDGEAVILNWVRPALHRTTVEFSGEC